MDLKHWKLVRSVHSRVNLNAAKQVMFKPRLWLAVPGYLKDYWQFRKMEWDGRQDADFFPRQFTPMLTDKQTAQPMGGTYLYQDCWGARRAFLVGPDEIVDVGSSTLLVAFLAQFRPVKSVDVRPIETKLEGLTSLKGNITELPFPDDSVSFLQSLCVIEHIGLGRYGDPIDPMGSERAIAEVKRVIKKNGHFTFSVPIGAPCLSFNAHRIFSREKVYSWFEGWKLLDEYAIHPAEGPGDWASPTERGQQIVVCFHFQKG